MKNRWIKYILKRQTENMAQRSGKKKIKEWVYNSSLETENNGVYTQLGRYGKGNVSLGTLSLELQ